MLFVANANSDTVTVLNTETRALAETIPMRLDAHEPFGSATDGLTLSRDGKILYVANAGNNAVGVVELPNEEHTNSIVQGFIPTDWYPGAVFADLYDLYVVNTKGLGSTNRDVYQITGTVNKIPLPTAAELRNYTAIVKTNSRLPQVLNSQTAATSAATPMPVPAHAGEPSVFKHVLYIIRENKTYDELLSDLPRGNRDPKLCIFGKAVTPNLHALAMRFVLLDNYYCNGVYSTDGHAWCTEANSSDYWEKSIGAANRSGQIGVDPLSYSSSGFIWNNVLQHGLTFYNYGVFGQSFPKPDSTWLQIYTDYTNHIGRIGFHTYIGNTPVLPAYSSTNVSGFNLKIPDQIRADGFLAEFSAAEKKGRWPAFNMFYLPDDHTAGGSPGFPTPRAQVADNDLATGRVIEAVTKSSFWSNTVIFLIEDDPQGGYDHVDGHRSICIVVSPYTKRGETVSAFYNQTGLIHTMEQIMGLPPMNQMDASGPLMTDCFGARADYTPYTAVPNEIPLNEMNPGTISALGKHDRHWAELSLQMDFSKPDLINDDTLNRIIWHSIKGNQHYPAEFAGPHGKGLKQLGLISAKGKSSGEDDDD
jgi:YVTN family beta-propeller protein